jgi:indolepyruvate ferredoxin oxidoreductase alpha subunit
MSVKDLTQLESAKVFLIANEAMVRGALEADVKVYAAYPGSPTSEILDAFDEIGAELGIKTEISTNEKVALETAAGAAMAGLRAMTSMKSVGLNVASDSYFSLGYTGVKGGLVLVVADDPHAHSSQSEQDGRFFGPAAYIPMLEPSDPSEAKRMVKEAFDLSEKYEVPVLIRTVTRVNHQSSIVEFEPLNRTPFKKVSWPHAPTRFITVADRARRFKANMLVRTQKIRDEFEQSPYNFILNSGVEIGIITANAGYNYTVEACRIMNLKPAILKLGTTYPLPEKKIIDFIKPLKKLIMVEELSPFLEHQIAALAKNVNPQLEIIGKDSAHFSETLEYNADIVARVLSKVFQKPTPVDYEAVLARSQKLKEGLAVRPPTFCPGCPHRASIHAVRKALKGVKHVLATDIGCYSMSPLLPLEYGDTLLSMGASLGVANGLQYAVEEPVIAMIGDSTFLHAGLSGLVNAAYRNANFKLFILDNDVTAMTGQQTNPNTRMTETTGVKRLVLEEILKGMGVENITIVDPYQVQDTVDKMKEALKRPGFGVIISRRVCALHGDRWKKKKGDPIIPNKIDKNACKRFYTCIRDFFCPAYSLNADRQASISPELCDGCNVCTQLCPNSAVVSTKEAKK